MVLGSWFGRQSAPMLGLDVSAGGARLVELSQDRADHLVLERCGMEPLERDWIIDGNIEKFDEVVDATRRLIRRTGTRASSVAMALPASEVISKRVILPAGLSEREMEFQVEAEASQYLSFPPDDVSLDFCVIGPSRTSPGDVEVLIAASRKEKVEDRQGLAEAVGLTPAILDVDSYASRLAVARLIERLPGSADGALVALVELGLTTSNLQVSRNDDLLFERDFPFGTGQLTQMLANHYGLSFEQARARRRADELPQDHVEAVLLPYMDDLASQIERALRFFFTSTSYQRVDRIMLAGEVVGLDGLAELVTQRNGMPCEIANPFEGMQMGRHVRHQQALHEAPAYLAACGLALRRFVR